MKQNSLAAECGRWAAASVLLMTAAAGRGAVSLADVRVWAGSPAGPGVSEAALVIDWRDGTPGLVWGYRWPSVESRTGRDMLEAVLGLDPGLTVDSTFFPGTMAWGGRSRSYDDAGTASYLDDRYWNYWVNNEVYLHPTDFMQNGHVVPPATVVVPLGSPFGSGRWVESPTGLADRPLVNGSWDGWAFGEYGAQPGVPVAVPEPGVWGMVVGGLGLLGMRRRRVVAAAVLGMGVGQAVASGPYAPGPGQAGSDAVAAGSAAIRSWATGVATFLPGFQRKGSASTATANYGSAASVLGPTGVTGTDGDYPTPGSGGTPGAPVLSLGDGGSLTLTFARPITDGAGADFAVFENGFASGALVFAELAFVEVSSNGSDFFRFPAVSCTATGVQVGAYGAVDPKNLRNLAGKHPAGWGTPFDLAELAAVSPLLDVRRVTHVRLVDVVGSVTGAIGSRDSLGNLVNDPFPTQFQTGGFDADAVGVMNEAADAWAAWVEAGFTVGQRGDAAVSGALADPDGDGWSNFAEYACGGRPLERESEALLRVSTGAGAGGVVLEFTRLVERGDVRWRLEMSELGGAWVPLVESAGGLRAVVMAGREADVREVTETGGAMVTVRVTVPVPVAGARVFRLKLERQS